MSPLPPPPRLPRGLGLLRHRPAQDGKRFVREVQRLGVKGNWRGALSLLRTAEGDGARVNTIMYNAAMAALSKSGRWEEAIAVLDGMEKGKGGWAPRDVWSFSSAMAACRAAGKADEAYGLLSRMMSQWNKQRSGAAGGGARGSRSGGGGSDVKPNLWCFNTVLSALATRGQYRRALSVVEVDMADAGVTPDLRTWSTLIDACRTSGGSGHQTVELMSRIRSAGFEPDVWCFSHCLNAACRGGEWELALGLLEDMGRAGLQPDCWSYSSAMKACVNAEQWQMVPVGVFPVMSHVFPLCCPVRRYIHVICCSFFCLPAVVFGLLTAWTFDTRYFHAQLIKTCILCV